MFSQIYLFVSSIVWCISLAPITGDWVEIKQKNAARTAPLVNSPKPSAVHETPPSRLRYEDLEHIIGPGFEEDLERFYEKHKKEISISTTTPKPDAHRIFLPQTNDPWSIYDKSPAVEPSVVISPKLDISGENSTTEHKMHSSVMDERKSIDAQSNVNSKTSEIPTQSDDSLKPKPSIDRKPNKTTKKGKPNIVRLASVKHTTQTPMSFAAIIKFLKSIQSTFVTTTARSIQEKIKMLEGFKDDLLINIGKTSQM